VRRMSAASSSIFGTALMAAILTGCGSTGPSSARPTGTPAITLAPTATAGQPSAEGLCAAFTEALAVAALGGPVSAPQSGDVLPRPNGIYCHYAAAQGSANAEAQLKEVTDAEFGELAETLGTTDAVTGVGETAFKRDTSITGDVGVTLAAWSTGRGVTVTIYNPTGEAGQMLDAAKAIAQAVLAS
jgi:hypothetical protein